MKWSMPAYVRDGAILLMTSAFKAHAALSFWRGGEIGDGIAKAGAMGQFGKLTSVGDLPDNLDQLIAEAVEVAATKPALRKAKTTTKPALEPHPELVAALAKNPAAQATFDAFAPSHRRDYVEWVNEAKRDETRTKRIAQAVEWMAEGKKRHWRYENC